MSVLDRQREEEEKRGRRRRLDSVEEAERGSEVNTCSVVGRSFPEGFHLCCHWIKKKKKKEISIDLILVTATFWYNWTLVQKRKK